MTASLAVHPAEKRRNRSIAARRAARNARFERERLIVDSLNRGVPVVEIAERIGVTEKRMRALVTEILARRTAAAPEDYAALQASRLNEALLVAYGAMSDKNLKAVALVVRIVRELDRYQSFVAADARAVLPNEVGKMSGEARQMECGKQGRDGAGLAGLPCNPARVEAAGHTASAAFGDTFPNGAEEGAAPAAPRAIGPEMAPQAPEKTESAAKKVARPNAFDAPPLEAESARSAQADDVAGEASNDAAPPPAEPPQPDPASAEPRAGAEMAPQAAENVDFTPGNKSTPTAAWPTEEPSPQGDAGASRAASPEQAQPSAIEPQLMEWPDSTAVVLAPDPSAPGGFRRMRIRFLRNGVAACADAA